MYGRHLLAHGRIIPHTIGIQLHPDHLRLEAMKIDFNLKGVL